MKASVSAASAEHATSDLRPACPRCGDLCEADAKVCPACHAPLSVKPPFPYDPPRTTEDPRVCRACRARVGSWRGVIFGIANTQTGKYHSGGDYGMTDCGVDATGDRYLWPL